MGTGQWARGNGHRAEEMGEMGEMGEINSFLLFTRYPLPVTRYPLPFLLVTRYPLPNPHALDLTLKVN